MSVKDYGFFKDLSIEAVEGQSVTLPCAARGSEPDKSAEAIEWYRLSDRERIRVIKSFNRKVRTAGQYKDRAQLDTARQNGSLLLERVRPSDGGVYECIVTLAHNVKKSSTLSLQVV